MDDYKNSEEEKYQYLKNAGLSEGQSQRFVDVEKDSDASDKEDYEKWSKEELHEKAKELNIAGQASMDKDLLIEAIRHNS